MKDSNFITIQAWMVTKLKLSSNNLLTYALIYGFSQDGQSEFTGSNNYICEWLNCSRNTAKNSLNYLCENEFIFRTETIINGIQFNKFKVNQFYVGGQNLTNSEIDRGGQNLTIGGSKFDPNNINNNIAFSAKKENSQTDIDKQITDAFNLLKDPNQNNHNYSATDFLNDYNFARQKYSDIKTDLQNLTQFEKNLFNQIKQPKEFFRLAIDGLFLQKNLALTCITRPKHLLLNIETYNDAGANKLKLYNFEAKTNQ